MTEADYGLDSAAMAAIESAGNAAGDAKAAEKPARAARPNALDHPFRAELQAGLPISRFVLTSGANTSYQARFDTLHGCYDVLRNDEQAVVCGIPTGPVAAKGVLTKEIGGVNTYAKLLRGYQAILLASAGLEVMAKAGVVEGRKLPPSKAQKAANKAALDAMAATPLPGGAKALDARKAKAAPAPAEPPVVVAPTDLAEPEGAAATEAEPSPVLTPADRERIMAEHPMGSELMDSMGDDDGLEPEALDDPALDDAPGSLMAEAPELDGEPDLDAEPAPEPAPTPAPAGEESQVAAPLPHEGKLTVAQAQAAFKAAKGTEHEADAKRALKSAQKREQRAKTQA